MGYFVFNLIQFIKCVRWGAINLSIFLITLIDIQSLPTELVLLANFIAESKGRLVGVKAKVQGLLKKFKSYEMLVTVCVYRDLLELIVPVSKVFEEDSLLPHEIKSHVSRTLLNLDEKLEEIGDDDEFLDSCMNRYTVVNQETLSGQFIKAGQKRKIAENRESVSVSFTMSDASLENAISKIHRIKTEVIPCLTDTLKQRFVDFSEDSHIYAAMSFMDPACWSDGKDYGKSEISLICEHFAEPLSHASFKVENVFTEWKNFKKYVKSSVKPGTNARSMWKSVLNYRRGEFPNLSLLASLIISISGSNSSVERMFSCVTCILSDRRLSMSHDTLANSVIVRGNDSNWTVGERNEIIDRAVEIYTSKRLLFR